MHTFYQRSNHHLCTDERVCYFFLTTAVLTHFTIVQTHADLTSMHWNFFHMKFDSRVHSSELYQIYCLLCHCLSSKGVDTFVDDFFMIINTIHWRTTQRDCDKFSGKVTLGRHQLSYMKSNIKWWYLLYHPFPWKASVFRSWWQLCTLSNSTQMSNFQFYWEKCLTRCNRSTFVSFCFVNTDRTMNV